MGITLKLTMKIMAVKQVAPASRKLPVCPSYAPILNVKRGKTDNKIDSKIAVIIHDQNIQVYRTIEH